MDHIRCNHSEPEWTWKRWQWGILHITQSSSINDYLVSYQDTRWRSCTSPQRRSLMLYPGHPLGKSYPDVEMQFRIISGHSLGEAYPSVEMQFSVESRTLVGGVLSLCRKQSAYFAGPTIWAMYNSSCHCFLMEN